MKRQFHSVGVALIATAILGSSAAAEERFQKLTAGQIRAKLAGMELTDNVHWRDLYQRNGTVLSESMGRKRTGKWRVEKDQLCIERERPDTELLRRVALGQTGRATARRSAAVAGRSRNFKRTELTAKEKIG